MTNYTKAVDFAAKDSLTTGNSAKIVKGTEIDTEFNAISTAIATKANIAGPTFTGTVTIPTATISTVIVPDASDGATIGSSSLEFSDLYLADGALIYLGDDQDTTLTHVADTGILLNSTRQLQFGDSGTYIHQSADGVLDLVSDTEIELTATTIDINGAVAMDGAITGGTNITISGELDAATLDISGNADIDGTLEADAYTVDGTALNEYIADTVGAMVTSNTESGITVAYQDGDNTLDFTVGTLNQDTTGLAATATALATARTIGGTSFDGTANIAVATATEGTNVTVSANNSTDETVYPTFVDGATGTQGIETDTGLTYNPSTGMLTSTGVTSTFTGNITGNVTGNTSGTAATVTTAAQSNITSLGTLTTLTVDNVIINGSTIGHTGDTDLITVASGIATVAGEVSMTTLDIGGTNVTSTAAELNTLDGITAVVGELNALDIGATAIGTAVASKAVILDSNKDYTGVRNLTISGDLDVDGTTNLDIVDIDGAVDMASTLQVDGAITSSAGATITTSDNTAQLALVSTDADANIAPLMQFYRNSSSPADNDQIGRIEIYGENDADEKILYGEIVNQIKDASDGSEDARMAFNVMTAGTAIARMDILPAETVFNQGGYDIDFRVESDNDVNSLFVQGSDGAVGIGTSSPASYYTNTLHLYGSASAAIKISNSDTGSGDGDGVDLALDDSEEFRIIQRENSAMSFWTNATLAQKIDASGHVTMPLQPAFSVVSNADNTNIPTDAVGVVVNFGSTPIYDQNSDFTTGTKLFTAPVTGKYQLSTNLYVNTIDDAAQYIRIRIATSNRNYDQLHDPRGFDQDLVRGNYNYSILADMDASDTAKVEISQYEGTAQMDVVAGDLTIFTGVLVC